MPDASPAPPATAERLLSRFAIQYLTVAWVRILSIAAVFVYAQWLAERALGSFFLAVAAFEVVAVLTDLGLSPYAAERTANNGADSRSVLAHAPRVRLAGALLYMAVLLAAWGFAGYAPAVPMLILAVALLPYALVLNARAYWQGRRRIRALQAASVIGNTVGPLAGILAAGMGAGVLGVAAAFSLSFWVEWALTLRWCRPEPPHADDRQFWSPSAFLTPARADASAPPGAALVRRALPFGLFTIVWFAYLRMDLFLIESMAPGRLAAYGFCLKLYTAALSFLQGGLLVALTDSRRIHDVWRRIPIPGPYLFLLSLAVLQSLAIWGPKALVTLLPPAYAGIEIPCRTLIYSGVAHAGVLVLGTLALGTGLRCGRAVWALLLIGIGLVFCLARLEMLWFDAVWPSWNRLFVDVCLLLVLLWLFRRERADGPTPPARDGARA